MALPRREVPGGAGGRPYPLGVQVTDQRERQTCVTLAALPALEAKKKPEDWTKARASTTDPEACHLRIVDFDVALIGGGWLVRVSVCWHASAWA